MSPSDNLSFTKEVHDLIREQFPPLAIRMEGDIDGAKIAINEWWELVTGTGERLPCSEILHNILHPCRCNDGFAVCKSRHDLIHDRVR